MIAIWALIAYIIAIVVWNGLLRRRIGEAMAVGYLVLLAFTTSDAFTVFRESMATTFVNEIIYAALAFVFMGTVLNHSGVIDRLINILNSLLGRVPGGAGYVATIGAGLMGSVSGSTTANAATVGSITIPWMERSNYPRFLSSTLVAGNSGLGVSIPPNTSSFILVGSAAVAPFMSIEQLFGALFFGGLWTIGYRIVLVFLFTRKYGITAIDSKHLSSPRTALATGWTSLLIGLGVAIPLLVTLGPTGAWFEEAIGDAFANISVIIWIPVFVTLVAAILGLATGKISPRPSQSRDMLDETAPQMATVAPTLIFAFAASEVLDDLGLGPQLANLLADLNTPLWLTALLVGIAVTLVAAPLTSTATLATIGGPAFAALTAADATPLAAAVAILIFSSTEGASPPGAAPLYIAAGIARVNPARTFVPLIVYYVIPMIVIGAAVASGLLPITT